MDEAEKTAHEDALYADYLAFDREMKQGLIDVCRSPFNQARIKRQQAMSRGEYLRMLTLMSPDDRQSYLRRISLGFNAAAQTFGADTFRTQKD